MLFRKYFVRRTGYQFDFDYRATIAQTGAIIFMGTKSSPLREDKHPDSNRTKASVIYIGWTYIFIITFIFNAILDHLFLNGLY